ncbi:MAG: carbon-nitrogen hydrolase family protein [Pirellulales bacterium]|nr:carbon-nitrogen hydrolase family protein [Pirellulales bacterium]
MLLACVQTDVKFADIPANLKRVLQTVEQAGRNGADLVVMPECMLCGYAYDSREEAVEHALTIEDPTFSQIAALAAAHNLHATIGFLEKDGDRLFNASALVGPTGVVGHYRKVHLPHLGVDRFVDRGDQPFGVLPAADVRVGLAICYDCSFPEPIRLLALAGADVIALGTNWPNGASHTADIVPPARSMENHLFFVAANRVGTENGFGFCGCSSICGPDGIVLAKAEGDEETILYAQADPAQARNKRIERTPGAHVIDRFDDRCPEYYSGLDR